MPLVRRFARTFADSEVVVSPSASCVGMVRSFYPRVAELAGDPALAAAIDDLRPRVLELSELLIDRLGATDVGARFPHRVTYHPSCHGLRLLELGERPLRLLRAVAGSTSPSSPTASSAAASGAPSRSRTPTPRPRCSPTRSRAILDTGAEVCTATDSSCLMHIGGGPVAPADRRAHDAPGRDPRHHAGVVTSAADPFPVAARRALADSQLRRNLARATRTIRDKRAGAVAELEDWEELREAGRALKDRVLRHLDEHLVALEAAVEAAGGTVHWARDGVEANGIVADLVAAAGGRRRRQGEVADDRGDPPQ